MTTLLDEFDRMAAELLSCATEYPRCVDEGGTPTGEHYHGDTCPAYYRKIFAEALRATAERARSEGYESAKKDAVQLIDEFDVQAAELVKILFTDGGNGQKARRLVLELENGRYGGWSKGPVLDQIVIALHAAAERARVKALEKERIPYSTSSCHILFARQRGEKTND